MAANPKGSANMSIDLGADFLGRVRRIEDHSAKAWPAQSSTSLFGWELRLAPQLSSRRPNSLNAVAPQPGQFLDALREAQQIYRAKGAPCIVRLQPLADEEAGEYLRGCGLSPQSDTTVETIALSGTYSTDPRIRLSEDGVQSWIDTYADVHGYGGSERAGIAAHLALVPIPQVFAVAFEEGNPCAVGRAALENGLLGLFQIATLPKARRKGLGRAVMIALLEWGRTKGADTAYLQVESENLGARKLYSSLGFQPLYTYDYWTVPLS